MSVLVCTSHLCDTFHVRSSQWRDTDKSPQCLVSFSEGDLFVIMEAHCKSTKEVTDDIDMTNIYIFFLISALDFFLCHSLLYTWPMCLRSFGYCFAPVPTCLSLYLSFLLTLFMPFFSCLSVCVWVCLCVHRKMLTTSDMSLCSLLRYQQDKDSYEHLATSLSGYCLAFEFMLTWN